MILRSVALQNWRAVRELQIALEPGLNVLHGPNEAGKSTLVEALDWALFFDVFSAPVGAIVPVHEPTARPQVQIEAVFADCEAVWTQILAPERACELRICRANFSDENLAGVEAQSRWRALMRADGLGVGRGDVAGSLLLARQGAGPNFADGGLRSGLHLAADGSFGLSKRLASVKTEVARRIEAALDGNWGFSLLPNARAGSDVARARDSLAALHAKKRENEALSGEIESLRAEIAALEKNLAEAGPREAEMMARVEAMGARQLAQLEAEKRLSGAETRLREAQNAHQRAAHRAGELARLQEAQQRDERDLARGDAAFHDAQKRLEVARHNFDAAQNVVQEAENEEKSGRLEAEAWRACLAVHEAARALKRERRDEERLGELGAAVLEAQRELDALFRAPALAEIRGWRAQWASIERLENEAALGIQVEVSTPAAQNLGWKRDQGRRESGETMAHGPLNLAAAGHLVLEIPGWGEIKIRTQARGVAELRVEIEAAREKLKGDLRDWKIDISALPGAFEVWEERRLNWDAAEAKRRAAVELLQAQETLAGTFGKAKMRVGERESEWEAARIACAPLEKVVEMRGVGRPEVKARLGEAETRLREIASRAARAKNEAATALQRWREAETGAAQAASKPEELKTTLQTRAEDIARLQGSDTGADLDELARDLWSARQELEAARAARQELGNGVSAWHIEDARRTAVALAQQRADGEKTLAAKHRDLAHFSDRATPAQSAEVAKQIAALETECARHETRLRALVMLDAALKREAAHVGRAFSGPLNETVAPWLSRLRGQETRLKLDDAGSRIETVETQTERGAVSLAFAELSAGTREQIAFVLRLFLAEKAAQGRPSGRLPLVVDDPFTQTDAARRAVLGELLREAAPSLQILFVTCHDAPDGAHSIAIAREKTDALSA